MKVAFNFYYCMDEKVGGKKVVIKCESLPMKLSHFRPGNGYLLIYLEFHLWIFPAIPLLEPLGLEAESFEYYIGRLVGKYWSRWFLLNLCFCYTEMDPPNDHFHFKMRRKILLRTLVSVLRLRNNLFVIHVIWFFLFTLTAFIYTVS